MSHANELKAQRLGAALPPLVVRAERIAQTVMLGAHGLRRAGTGTSFWSYRNYAFGDSVQRIDWHKSAKSDETLILEHEWEAANTLWLWVQSGPRMDYKSHLAAETKSDVAQVLGLAMAQLSLRAHERIGLLGTSLRASSGRHMLERLSQELPRQQAALPLPNRTQRRSAALLISDFLDEPAQLQKGLTALADVGMRGHLVQIADPAEETLPWNGRVDFKGLDLAKLFRVGKTQDLRGEYQVAYAAQRATVAGIAKKLSFSFTVHRTDQPLNPLVLALHQRMGRK